MSTPITLLRVSAMLRFLFATLALALTTTSAPGSEPLRLNLRFQTPLSEGDTAYHIRQREELWLPQHTALIICDMWDSHHCVNAVRRVGQIAPRIDSLAKTLRNQGVTIIHAPSSCMDFYAEHPARRRTLELKEGKDPPKNIAAWCDQIPSEESIDYPLDQSDGGEDDDPIEHASWIQRLKADGKDPRVPWFRQTPIIAIDPQADFISDDGKVIWSLLQDRGIENVILVGVHTNMCVLGRPFGLRRLAAAGKNVVLCRDLTDTMYNPASWPYASHFTGTDLIVSHIERHICPTISSDQILGGEPHRFALDRRPHIVTLIGESEYGTKDTLPRFAAAHLSKNYRVTIAHADTKDKNRIVGADAVRRADVLLVSVRRRALPKQQLDLVRAHVASGKPMVGIRTASHAFALRRGTPPDGHDVWPEFDSQVWGGAYDGHYGNDLAVQLHAPTKDAGLISASDLAGLVPGGSLYKNTPLQPGTTPVLHGSVDGAGKHPLAWTYVRSDGGKSFYTSLGHVKDFEQAEFQALLLRGIHWASGVDARADIADTKKQAELYASGSGKQR
ncbi:MAG: hypothetical protein Aurels2KO_21120 [Aureliella sp.]